jgi:hypothetical protein
MSSAVIRNLRSTLLSPGCFLAALRAGQPTSSEVSPSPVPPQHEVSTSPVEAPCSAAPRLFLALDYGGTLVPIASYRIISKILQGDGSKEEEEAPRRQRQAFL